MHGDEKYLKKGSQNYKTPKLSCFTKNVAHCIVTDKRLRAVCFPRTSKPLEFPSISSFTMVYGLTDCPKVQRNHSIPHLRSVQTSKPTN